jgi:hypothetical protein
MLPHTFTWYSYHKGDSDDSHGGITITRDMEEMTLQILGCWSSVSTLSPVLWRRVSLADGYMQNYTVLNPEDSNLHLHRKENLKFQVI